MNLTKAQKQLLSELYNSMERTGNPSMSMKTNRTVQSLVSRKLITITRTYAHNGYCDIELLPDAATYIANSKALWCKEARQAVEDTAAETTTETTTDTTTDTATNTISAMLDILASREHEKFSERTLQHYHTYYDNDVYREMAKMVSRGVQGLAASQYKKDILQTEIMVCFQDDTLSIIQGTFEANEAPSWLALEKVVYGLSNGVDILVFYNCDWLNLFLDTPPKPFANPMPTKVVPPTHTFKEHPKRERPNADMALEVVKEFEALKVPPRETLTYELHNALEEALHIYTQILNPYLYERLRLAIIKMLGYALFESNSTRTDDTTYQDTLSDMLYKLGLDHKLNLAQYGLKN